MHTILKSLVLLSTAALYTSIATSSASSGDIPNEYPSPPHLTRSNGVLNLAESNTVPSKETYLEEFKRLEATTTMEDELDPVFLETSSPHKCESPNAPAQLDPLTIFSYTLPKPPQKKRIFRLGSTPEAETNEYNGESFKSPQENTYS